MSFEYEGTYEIHLVYDIQVESDNRREAEQRIESLTDEFRNVIASTFTCSIAKAKHGITAYLETVDSEHHLIRRHHMQTELSVCVDCITVISNGEDAETSPDYGGMYEHWNGWLIAPKYTKDTGEPTEEYFGKTSCDGCGNHLAGARYDYVAVPRH